MRIAINTRFSNYAYEEGYGRFTREVSGRMAAASGGTDEFLFVYDRPVRSGLPEGSRVSAASAVVEVLVRYQGSGLSETTAGGCLSLSGRSLFLADEGAPGHGDP